ncbi:MAG: TolC family protein [Acidobacteria bacterium]|nr:TolC family protein [Acidobacteriota bacterium]
MIRMPGRSPSHVLAVPLLTTLLTFGTTPVMAQGTAAAPLGEAAPVMTFQPAGISLDDAIALTLRHDPNLQQGRADVQRREGLLQQFRGAFDTTLFITAEYTHRTQELSESQKETEARKRDQLDNAVVGREEGFAEAQAVRALVQSLQNAPVGGGPLDEIARISPATAATVRVLDQLILTSAPGQRQQFINIRSTFISDALAQFDDEVKRTGEDLDRLTEQRRLLGDAPVDDVFIDASGSLTVSKRFRSGILFSPFFDSTFTGTNFKGKPRAQELGGKGISDQLTFRAGVNFTLPLLRGRGAQSIAAAERAASIDVTAGQLILDHQAAASVFRTVQAYWNARSAQEAAAIARQSVEFQTTLTALTNQIIGVGDLPQVELARARATEARARARMQDAERRYHEARVALADAMGIAVSGDPASLPTAADPFPQAATAGPVATLIEQAVGRRPDLQAAARSIEAGAILVDGARADLKPVLDLEVGTWFTALGEGSGPKALDRWVGPSAGVGVRFEKPLGNNQAQGVLVQREADAALRQIAQRDLDRRIRLGVVESAATLQEVADRVAQAEAAVGFYQTTVNAEMQRFRAGDVTLLDTVLTQQQQIDAQLTLILARQELAQRLAQLRFQTGTLVTVPSAAARD